MQKTALDIIYNAYEFLGIKAEHDTSFSSEKADYGLVLLQSMLDMWRLDDSLSQSWDAQSTVTLIPGQETYTVGPSGDLDTIFTRPEGIIRAWVVLGNKSYPMSQVTASEYHRAPRTQLTTTTIPFTFYYTQEYPLSSIIMYPKPSEAIEFSIQYSAPIEAPQTLSDVVSYGPGYILAVTFCLAQLIAVTYNIDSSRVDSAASQYKNNLRQSRKRRIPMAIIDPACNVRGSAGHNLASTPGAMYDISSNSIRGSF